MLEEHSNVFNTIRSRFCWQQQFNSFCISRSIRLFLGDFFAGNQTIEFAPPDPVDSYANPVLYNGAGGLSFRVEVPTGWNILGWPFPFPQSFGETITKGLGVDSLNQTFDQGLIIAKDKCSSSTTTTIIP